MNEALINRHDGNGIGKAVRLVDYLAIKSAVEVAQIQSLTNIEAESLIKI